MSTDLASDRSAVPAGAVARDASSSSPFPMPLLGVESGSVWPAAVICAELVYGPVALTVTEMLWEADPPGLRVPTVQTPLPLL